MKVDLDGRLAVLTGSAGPLSAGIAEALTANGATVVRTGSRGGVLRAADLDDVHHASGARFLLVNVSRGAEDPTAEEQAENDGHEARNVVLATRHFAGQAKRVVNVVSAAGLVPIRGAAAFSAEQAGLVALTRTLAMELGPDTVVNAVAVGAFTAAAEEQVQGARLLTHTALRRPGHIGEIAAAVLFLADPENSYMTGHTLNVDGGWAAGYARNF